MTSLGETEGEGVLPGSTGIQNLLHLNVKARAQGASKNPPPDLTQQTTITRSKKKMKVEIKQNISHKANHHGEPVYSYLRACLKYLNDKFEIDHDARCICDQARWHPQLNLILGQWLT